MPRLSGMREKWAKEAEERLDSLLNQRELLMRDVKDLDKKIDSARVDLHFVKTGREELPDEVKSPTTKSGKQQVKEAIELLDYEPFTPIQLADLLDYNDQKAHVMRKNLKRLEEEGLIRLVQKGGPGKSAVYKQLKPPVESKR